VPRLYVERIQGMDDDNRAARAYIDPGRSGVQFWDALRVTTRLLVGPDQMPHRDRRQTVWAIIDTGAPLTLFPEQVWTQFPRSMIEFLSVPADTASVSLSVAGGRCPYRLGWIWLGVIDNERPAAWLPARRVLAQFAADDGRLRRNALVGLSESVLTGRRLIRETTLEVDEPDPVLPDRRRPTFGQVWRLMDL
jgi:hypothetical protein